MLTLFGMKKNVRLISSFRNKPHEYALTHSRKTTHKVLLKLKTSLRDAYARGYIANDFARLVKTRGENPPKRKRYLLQISKGLVIIFYSIQKMNLTYLYY